MLCEPDLITKGKVMHISEHCNQLRLVTDNTEELPFKIEISAMVSNNNPSSYLLTIIISKRCSDQSVTGYQY